MEEYNVTFVHPSTGDNFTAQVSPDLTVNEAINELVAENFIAPETGEFHYTMGVTGGSKAEGNQTLRDAGIHEGSTINVISNEVAGALC